MTAGQHLCKWRKSQGLTQEELGARIGRSQSAVSAYENDEDMPDVDTAIRIEEATAGAIKIRTWRRKSAA